jgi:hypothetical protein
MGQCTRGAVPEDSCCREGAASAADPAVQRKGRPAPYVDAPRDRHEEYHRGQIALAARMLGHLPALSKLIHGTA